MATLVAAERCKCAGFAVRNTCALEALSSGPAYFASLEWAANCIRITGPGTTKCCITAAMCEQTPDIWLDIRGIGVCLT